VKELTFGFVQPLKGMCTKEVTLGLKKILR
jgi:hypothetical protein